jgi:hypothetical protein
MSVLVAASYVSRNNSCTLACMRPDRMYAACDCKGRAPVKTKLAKVTRKRGDPLLGLVAALHIQGLTMPKDEVHKHRDLQAQIPVRLRAGGRTPRSGIPELASLRGHQIGVHDAYKALQKKFPEAAAYLLKRFHMTRDGNIKL